MSRREAHAPLTLSKRVLRVLILRVLLQFSFLQTGTRDVTPPTTLAAHPGKAASLWLYFTTSTCSALTVLVHMKLARQIWHCRHKLRSERSVNYSSCDTVRRGLDDCTNPPGKAPAALGRSWAEKRQRCPRSGQRVGQVHKYQCRLLPPRKDSPRCS
jgi:hypothetical protein